MRTINGGCISEKNEGYSSSKHVREPGIKNRAKTLLVRLCFCAESNTLLFLRYLRVYFSTLFNFHISFFISFTHLFRKFSHLFHPFFEKRDSPFWSKFSDQNGCGGARAEYMKFLTHKKAPAVSAIWPRPLTQKYLQDVLGPSKFNFWRAFAFVTLSRTKPPFGYTSARLCTAIRRMHIRWPVMPHADTSRFLA